MPPQGTDSGELAEPSEGGLPKEPAVSEPRRVSRYWQGYINGTNRGRLWLRIPNHHASMSAKAVLFDQRWGPATVRLRRVPSSDLSSLQLRLMAYRGSAPASPLDGGMNLPGLESAEFEVTGNWWTDVGAGGRVVVRSAKRGRLAWAIAVSRAGLQTFLPRALGTAYVVGLVAIGLYAITGGFRLSAWQLILVLFPTPFLLRRQIKDILADLGVSKAGPLEFKAQASPDTIGAAAPPLGREAGVDADQVTTYLAKLDEFFVPITKSLLIMISFFPNGMDLARFIHTARNLGAQEANIPTILEAVTGTRVAEYRQGRIALTPLGRMWLQRWTQISGTQVPNPISQTGAGA